MREKKSKSPIKKPFLTYKKMPGIHSFPKFLLINLAQIVVAIVVIIFLFFISSKIWFGALIGQCLVVFFAVFPVFFLTKKSSKIRSIYLKKYKNLAYQQLFYKFIFWADPFATASLYFPILLKTDYFLPRIIDLPSNIMTISILPFYIALPFGFIFVIIGILIRKPSGGFNLDTDSFVYLLYPKNSRMLNTGLYKFIRHPRYLGRGFFVIGLGILANNWIAICASIIHFLPYWLLIRVEEDELIRRFKDKYKEYRKNVPALFPHIENLKEFAKSIVRINKK